jgi:chromosome segregation ATPase
MFIDLVESIVDPFGKHKFSPYTSVDISFKNGKYQETVQLPHKESGKKLEQPIKAVINKALSKLQEINQQEERNAKRVVHIQAELPKVQEKVQRAQNELTGLKSGEPKLEKQKSLLEKQIKLLDAQEKAYQETISEHRENLDIYEFELIERAQLQNSTKEDLQLITEKIKAEKESIRLAQEGLDLIGKQKVTTQKDIAEMEGSINTLKNQIQSKNDEITLYKNSITRYQRELDKLTK